MQIEIKHICTGESGLWRSGEKQLIHGPLSQDSNGWFGGGGGRMGRNDQANMRPRGVQCDIGTIEEITLCPTLRVGRVVIWGKRETGNNSRQMEQPILFATHNDPKPTGEGEGEHGSCTIQS